MWRRGRVDPARGRQKWSTGAKLWLACVEKWQEQSIKSSRSSFTVSAFTNFHPSTISSGVVLIDLSIVLLSQLSSHHSLYSTFRNLALDSVLSIASGQKVFKYSSPNCKASAACASTCALEAFYCSKLAVDSNLFSSAPIRFQTFLSDIELLRDQA